MQAILIARMQYTCNSCGDATAGIDDIDVIQFQCHCMSYHIFQKFILPKKLTWLNSWANQKSFNRVEITERSYNIYWRVVFSNWLNERLQAISNVLQRVGKIRGWQWCWWHRYFGDLILMTDLRCCWENQYVGDFVHYVGDFLNVLHRSSTSWIGHQYLELVTNTFGLQHPSPTCVTNIHISMI